MLKFKQFISERRRATPQIQAWLGTRAKPYEYWMTRQFELPFPISKPMLDWLQNLQKDVEAFHITDIDSIATLFDLQNSAKSLSVTTEIKSERAGMSMLEGVETVGGIIVELRGDVPFAGDFDIFSSPDNQGRRWIDLKQFQKEHFRKSQNDSLFHNWDLIYRKTIVEHTKSFIKKNWYDLLDFGFDGDYMGYAVRDIYWAKVFWIGSQDFIVKGMSKEESLAEKGIIHKLGRVAPELRGKRDKLDKEAKMTLFRITKDLFDKAEDYFTDNLLDFFGFGTEDKVYEYNELVMDNFTIQRVIYNYKYTPSDMEAFIGKHMSREEIESSAMEETEILKYFKKWVSKKSVSREPKYPSWNW